MIAVEVKLWGTTIGALSMLEGESVAREHRENHLAVDEVLGAAEAHEPDANHAARPHF